MLGELERKINILETFAVFVRKVSEKNPNAYDSFRKGRHRHAYFVEMLVKIIHVDSETDE